MASIRLKRTNEDGTKVYEIRAARKRGQGQKSMQWIAPKGWSQKSIDRELNKVAAELDRQVKAGEVLTRAEQAAKEKAAADAEAKIKTVVLYGDTVYLPYKQTQVAARTLEYYTSMLKRYIYPAIGKMKITDVRAYNLKQIITDAQTRGLGFSTVRGIYLTLAQMFDQANKDDVIEVNPMSKVNAPRRRKDDKRRIIDTFTAEQMDHFNECLENEPLKWRAFFTLLSTTGVRKGEACGLRWDAVDFENGLITIRTNAIRTVEDGKTSVKVVKPKNGKTRVVPLFPETAQLLKEMQLQSGRFEYVFVQRGEDGRPCEKPLIPNTADHYLRQFMKKYSIDFKCNPHKFRHTFATNLIKNGVSLPVVAKYIGDNPETVARFYLHSNNDDVIQAGEVLQKASKRA